MVNHCGKIWSQSHVFLFFFLRWRQEFVQRERKKREPVWHYDLKGVLMQVNSKETI